MSRRIYAKLDVRDYAPLCTLGVCSFCKLYYPFHDSSANTGSVSVRPNKSQLLLCTVTKTKRSQPVLVLCCYGVCVLSTSILSQSASQLLDQGCFCPVRAFPASRAMFQGNRKSSSQIIMVEPRWYGTPCGTTDTAPPIGLAPMFTLTWPYFVLSNFST
jgi:hypothetical protein